jgi:FkbM family methyltransferase
MLSKVVHYINRYLYHRKHRLLPAIAAGEAACGQDVFVAELLGNKSDGVFFDIGANDGVTISNSLYFEKEMGWSGVAVEPIPGVFDKLKTNRNCHLVNGCVAPQAGKARFVEVVGDEISMLSTLEENNAGLTARRLRKNKKRHQTEIREIEVECFTFKSLTEKFGIKEIDFLSVDTEGGELEILKSIDFDETPVSVISVENNYYTNSIRDYLEKNGYIYIGTFKVDEIYMFGGKSLRGSIKNS